MSWHLINQIASMRNTIFRVVLSLLTFVQTAQAQPRSNYEGIYSITQEYFGTSLELKKDSSFSFSAGMHLQKYYSNGKWEKRKDTIILNSNFQKQDLPITIQEITTGNRDSLVFVDVTTNLSGDLIKDAIIYINNDTINKCMPAFEKDCKITKGILKTLKIELSNNITSKWHKITSSNCDTIKVVVLTSKLLDNYAFLQQSKLLITSTGLIPLEQDDKTHTLKRSDLLLQKK